MYVVVMEDFTDATDLGGGTARTLEQAFAQVCCLAGYGYHFEQQQDCWLLMFTDIERPECSPDPVRSTYVKRADAQQDLMSQAIDGRLKGYTALPLKDVERLRAAAMRLGAAE